MGITVAHQPSAGVIGKTAGQYGEFKIKREDQLRAEDYAQKIELMNIESNLNEVAAQKQQERQKELNDINYEREMEKLNEMAELDVKKSKLTSDINEKEKDQDAEREREQFEWEYTTKQKMQIEQINNNINAINNDQTLKPAEKEELLWRENEKKYGIQPSSRPKEKTEKAPNGKVVGETWSDADGNTWVQQSDGTPKIESKAKESTAVIEAKEKMDAWSKFWTSISNQKDEEGQLIQKDYFTEFNNFSSVWNKIKENAEFEKNNPLNESDKAYLRTLSKEKQSAFLGLTSDARQRVLNNVTQLAKIQKDRKTLDKLRSDLGLNN
jgi:hypothetical protein